MTHEQLEKDVERIENALAGLKLPESMFGREIAVEAGRVRDLQRNLQHSLRLAKLKLAQSQKRRTVRAREDSLDSVAQ